MRGKAQRLQDVFIKLSTRLIYQRPLSPMLGLGIRDGGLSLGCLRLEISQHIHLTSTTCNERRLAQHHLSRQSIAMVNNLRSYNDPHIHIC